GTAADRTQQDAIEFGAARNLIARDERKQSPIRAREEEERDRSHQSCAQVGIVSRMPEADHEGTRQTFRWKAGALRGWRPPPEQGSYDAKIAQCVDPERRRDPHCTDDDTAQRRPD